MKKKNAIIAVLCIAIFISCLIFGDVRWQTNDDALLNLIAAGAYGEPSQYMIYTNILLGYVFKALYHLIAGINWYLWIYLSFNLAAILSICLIFSRKFKTVPAIFITLLVNFLLYKEYYLCLQYTKNATLYIVTGGVYTLFLLCRLNEDELQTGKKWLFWGELFVCCLFTSLGMCARKESFVVAIPFSATMLALYFLFGRSKNKPKWMYLLAIILPIVSALSCLAVHTYKMSSNPDWDYFTKWNKIMTDKRDFGNYNLEWNYDEYIANGYTEVDFNLMMHEWMWNDTDYFTLDYLEKMKEIGKDNRQNELRVSFEVFVNELKRIGLKAEESVLPWAYLLIFIFGIFIYKNNIVYLLAQLIWLLGEYYYLIISRRLEWHVESGIWYCSILMSLAIILIPKMHAEKVTSVCEKVPVVSMGIQIVASICLIVSMINQLNYDFGAVKHYKIVQEPDGTYETAQGLHELSDYFFVTSIDDMYGGLCGAKNIFDVDSSYADYFANSVSIGGWMIPSPIGNYHANQRGISNPVKALFERDDVYYYGGGLHMGYIFAFIDEKYGPGASVEQVTFPNGMTAWKYHMNK